MRVRVRVSVHSVHVRMYGRAAVRTGGRTVGRAYGRTDEWAADGRPCGRTGGRASGRSGGRKSYKPYVRLPHDFRYISYTKVRLQTLCYVRFLSDPQTFFFENAFYWKKYVLLQTLCSFSKGFLQYFVYNNEVTNPMLCRFLTDFCNISHKTVRLQTLCSFFSILRLYGFPDNSKLETICSFC